MRFSLTAKLVCMSFAAILLSPSFSSTADDNWLPVPNLRWRVPTSNDPTDEELIKKIHSRFARIEITAIPNFRALPVGDIVLMRTPNQVTAINFANGKRVWEFPWDVEVTYQAIDVPTIRVARAAARQAFLKQRLWDDQIYADLSTDGKRVFFLDGLDVAHTAFPMRVGLGGRVAPDHPRPYNRLVALEPAREGAIVWQIGGGKGDGLSDEPKAVEAFFLSAPVVADGGLCVLAEQKTKIHLFIIDPASGALNKSTELMDVGEQTVLRSHIRRLAGAKPVVTKDYIVCPTSSGRVFGVSTDKYKVKWTFEYERDNLLLPRVFTRIERPSVVGKRWSHAGAIVLGERVLVTAMDSRKLHCLNLKTGKPAWDARDRGDTMFIETPDEDSVLLVGEQEIEAIGASDGKPKWKEALKLPAPPSGRGYTKDGSYYLPTAEMEVLRIDLAKQTIVDRVKTEFPLGNIVPHKNDILSQGTDWLATFPADK